MVRFAIDVLLVVPGVTRSDLWQHLLRNTGRYRLDVNRGMPPEKVAAGILRALKKNRTETVLGWDARWLLRVQSLSTELGGRPARPTDSPTVRHGMMHPIVGQAFQPDRIGRQAGKPDLRKEG